jgi:class 3 adenylate cyclase
VAATDPLNGPEPVRISDAERNEAAGRLHAFFAEGRLSVDELSERLDEVYTARTDVEMAGAFRELPHFDPAAEVAERQGSRLGARRRIYRLAETATPAAICTAVWAMTGHGYFWPEWVYLGTGIVMLQMLRPRRHRHRPRHDRAITAGHRHPRHDELAPRVLGGPGGTVGTHQPRKVLTAVFIDIVSSTEKAAAMGDRAWVKLLRRFTAMADGELVVRRGRKLALRGDEVVATFLSPAPALAYALAVRDGARALDLQIRAGVHTGEMEGHHRDLNGIALHIGQRVSTLAAPGEVLVSSTVRDLAMGAGFGFDDRGEHELRGVPGRWRVFAVATS